MNERPFLFDPKALARNRQRARPDMLFLQHMARDDVHDRLGIVNKDFQSPAIVTPFPEVWENALQSAKIVKDDDVLDLQENAHDLVVHALGLHWANDPVGQLIQCRRALRPDGLLLACALGGQTLNELRIALATAEAEVSGGLSPRIVPMAEIRDLGALMQRAGLALPVADSLQMNVEYEDAFALMRDLRAMGETNALSDRPRQTARKGLFERANEVYRDSFTAPSGRISATFELIMLTGWAPDASQPQALRPGSAKSRLADALGSDEFTLRD